MAQSTLDGYTKAVNSARMKAFVKGRTIESVTPGDVREFAGGIDGTAKFVRNLLTPLRATFEDALNDDTIKANPFDRVAMAKLLKKTSKASEYEVDPFSQAEREAILKAARADEKPMVQFWLASGLRPGELIAFKWMKVDWTNRKAKIDLNQVAKKEKLPKTAAGLRDIDLTDDAIAALLAQNLQLRGWPACLAQPPHRAGLVNRRSDPQNAVATAARTRRRALPQPIPVPAHIRQRPVDRRHKPLVRR